MDDAQRRLYLEGRARARAVREVDPAVIRARRKVADNVSRLIECLQNGTEFGTAPTPDALGIDDLCEVVAAAILTMPTYRCSWGCEFEEPGRKGGFPVCPNCESVEFEEIAGRRAFFVREFLRSAYAPHESVPPLDICLAAPSTLNAPRQEAAHAD